MICAKYRAINIKTYFLNYRNLSNVINIHYITWDQHIIIASSTRDAANDTLNANEGACAPSKSQVFAYCAYTQPAKKNAYSLTRPSNHLGTWSVAVVRFEGLQNIPGTFERTIWRNSDIIQWKTIPTRNLNGLL